MSAASLDVVGIGNAIVDVLAHVDDAFIAANGLDKGVMTLIDEAQAGPRPIRLPVSRRLVARAAILGACGTTNWVRFLATIFVLAASPFRHLPPALARARPAALSL
jgi:hypothetical protein